MQGLRIVSTPPKYAKSNRNITYQLLLTGIELPAQMRLEKGQNGYEYYPVLVFLLVG
jgi:hypothetical protein